MPDRYRKLDGRDGISVLGFVESLPDFFNRIRVSVVPLRVGAGAKGKVAASLAAGVPCVATPVGVEGMQLAADREIAVAETADAPGGTHPPGLPRRDGVAALPRTRPGLCRTGNLATRPATTDPGDDTPSWHWVAALLKHRGM